MLFLCDYRYHVFLLLYYMKIYPPQQSLSVTIIGKESNAARVVQVLSEMALELANRINLIEKFWEERFDEKNLLPHLFSCLTTGCLDVFPLYRRRSTSRIIRDRTYNGKYKHHVDKFQIICDHLGRCIWLSGPHPGSDHDGSLWSRFNPISRMHPNETILADKAYIGQARCISQFKKKGKKGISEEQKSWNTVHGFYRVTVEHAIGFSKFFGILRQDFRGQVGLKDCSMEQIRNFSRLIFEICNLHWFLSDKQKRDIRPFFVDDIGLNLLPRLDECLQLRLLRRRLASTKAHFLSKDQSINLRHVNTGYDASYFSEGDEVWYYRIASKMILRAKIWAISKEHDFGTDNVSYSVRTSKGNYDVHVPATMLIPVAANQFRGGKPSLEDFVLYRSSGSPANKLFGVDCVKTLYSKFHTTSMLSNQKISKFFKERTLRMKMKQQISICDSIRSNYECMKSEKMFQGIVRENANATNLDDMWFSESSSSSSNSSSNSDMDDHNQSNECGIINITNSCAILSDVHQSTVSNALLSSSTSSNLQQKEYLQSLQSKRKRQKIGGLRGIEESSYKLVAGLPSTCKYSLTSNRSREVESLPSSFVQKESFEEKRSHPLIPYNIMNNLNIMEESIFVSFTILSCCRFPCLLNFLLSPELDENYSLILLRSLRYSLETIQICRKLDLRFLTASLQLTSPNFFLQPQCTQQTCEANFISLFKEILRVVFIEEDFFYNNSNHKFDQISSLSLRFSTYIRIDSDQFFFKENNVVGINQIGINVVDEVQIEDFGFYLDGQSRMSGQDPINFIFILDKKDRICTGLTDYNINLNKSESMAILQEENGPENAIDVEIESITGTSSRNCIPHRVTHAAFPGSLFECAYGVCVVENRVLFVNIKEKYAIFIREAEVVKAKFIDFDQIPINPAWSISSTPVTTFSFFSTCFFLVCERSNYVETIFKSLDPFNKNNKNEIPTDFVYNREESVDYNCIPSLMGDSLQIKKHLLTDTQEEISDFMIQDIFDVLKGILPHGYLFLSYPMSFSTTSFACKSIMNQHPPTTETTLVVNVLFQNHFFLLALRLNSVYILDSIEYWDRDKTNEVNDILKRIRLLSEEITLMSTSNVMDEFGAVYDRQQLENIAIFLLSLPKETDTVEPIVTKSSRKSSNGPNGHIVIAKFEACMKQSNSWSCGVNAIFNMIALTGFWESPAKRMADDIANDSTSSGVSIPAKRTRGWSAKSMYLNNNQLLNLKFLFSILFLRDRVIIHTSFAQRVSKDFEKDCGIRNEIFPNNGMIF